MDKARDRLFRAAGINEGSVQAGINAAFAKMSIASGSKGPAQSQTQAQPLSAYGNAPYQPQVQASGYASQQPSTMPAAPVSAPLSTASNPYAPASATYGGYSDQSYAPAQPQQSQGYQPNYGSNGYPGDPQPQGYGGGYAPNQQQQQQPYGNNNQQAYGAPPAQTPLGPPPRAGLNNSTSTASTPPPIPAAQRRDMPGWNDAPQFSAPPKRPQSAAKEHKPAPIMSPFPNAHADPMANAGANISMPPSGPPRAPSRNQPSVLPPPPKGGARPPSAQAVARQTQPQQPPRSSTPNPAAPIAR